jgi:hypothetical protein
VAEFDFQKLGNDRLSQNIKRAITNPVGTISTGDISRGELVTHTTDSSDVEYVGIRSRATACLLVGCWFENSGSADWNYRLEASENRIAVKTSTSTPCTFTFWVF